MAANRYLGNVGSRDGRLSDSEVEKAKISAYMLDALTRNR